MAKELVSNRKARYNYEILETYEAGIVLTGSEIKSLRDHGGNIQDAFVTNHKQELFLLEASIAPYKMATFYNHEEKRKRKLLLHKKEIEKLIQKSKEKGLSIIALSIYLIKGRAKVKIALVRGKKSYDKRKSKIEKEKNKEASAALKRKNLGSF